MVEKLRQPDDGESFALRLLVLLGVAVASASVAVAATGALHFHLFSALVAIVAALSAVMSLPIAQRRFRASREKTERSSTPSLDRTKKILILAMIAGAIAYVGGRATFALFSAETSNSNSSMASGTLTMGNKVGSGTVCMSSAGSTLDNVNSACSMFLNLQNMAPGVSSAQAKLTIENDGSIDASKFYLFAPYPRTTLSGALTQGNAVGSLQVSGFGAPLALNDQVMVSYGGHSQTFTVAATSAGATTITISGTAPVANYSYPVGARVDDLSGNSGTGNTDCYDSKTTSSTVAGASIGTDLNFNSPTGNPLCQSLIFWVQEQSATGKNYCWYGLGSSASTPSSVGQCRTPTVANPSSTLSTSGATTTIPVAALTGNIAQNDQLVISQGGSTQTVTAAANAFINDTSITVNSFTPNFAYTTAATITDTTALGALNGDAGDTISQFDTGHPQTGRIQLYPVTANNTANTSATVELNKYSSSGYQRVFYIGAYMPAPAGVPQNGLQGLVSTFGLSWHIDQ